MLDHAFDLAWVNRLVADNLSVVCVQHTMPPPLDCVRCWALGKVQDDLAKGRIVLAEPSATEAGRDD